MFESITSRRAYFHIKTLFLSSYYLFTEPVVITAKPSVWVEEHQNVTLTCNVTGQPFPTVTWSKAGKKLNSNSKTSGEKLALSRVTLFHVTPHKDNGTYTCKAKNHNERRRNRYKGHSSTFPQIHSSTPPVNITVLVRV